MSNSPIAYHHSQAVSDHQNSGSFFQTLKSCRSRPSRDSGGNPAPPFPSIQDKQLGSKRPITPSTKSCSNALPPSRDALLPIMSDVAPAPTLTAPLKPLLPHHTLSLTYSGECFTIDLKTLESNPQPIMELLKATLSDRGSWIMVAAHYRRSGNPRAAISVLETMITVMSEQGFLEETLNPAFLLLSGCETDIARRAEAEQTNDAEEHRNRAQAWLQKTYGTFDTASSMKNGVSAIPSNPRSLDTDQSGPYPTASSVSEYKCVPPLEIRFEGKIQSLLEERKELSLRLAQARAAKRKLEDDLAYESGARRRLLRDNDDLRDDLAMSRKMENFALGQVRREVEARRKAEENARIEKAMRLEIQTLWKHGTAPPFAEIANAIKTEDRPAPTKSNAS